MSQKMNRRQLLKSGLMTLGGMTMAPHLSMGAFGTNPLSLDSKNRIFRSPLVREHFLPTELPMVDIVARLNLNENPYGPPVSAQKAIAWGAQFGSRYPGKDAQELLVKIAKKEGVPTNHIMLGPGSSELLENVAVVLFRNGGNIISADPCFMSIIQVAQSVGATWKPIPCSADWSHDLTAMEEAIDAQTKLVYICNPNNPTGTITPGKALLDFCSRVSEKVPVFIDEAYIELTTGADTQSMVSLLTQNKNVIICRTFSKIMGMAGIRVGYLVGLPPMLNSIHQITRSSSGLSCPSLLAASAALDDLDFQEKTKKLNQETKTYLCGELKKLGYSYLPSYTNFILFPIHIPGKEMLSKMAEKGIAIRTWDIKNKPYCRVSLGTMDEIKLFVNALAQLS